MVLRYSAAAAFVTSVLSAAGASAATLTFDTYFTTTDNTLAASPTPIVSVNDDTAGLLTFSVGSSGVSGNLSGFGFDTGGTLLNEADILNESEALAQFGSPDNNVGGGVNVNGTYGDGTNNPEFDVLFRIDQTDVSGTPFTFQVSTDDLVLADLERVFLRFQSVGDDSEASAKLIGYPGDDAQVIPLPASALLLLGGMGGLGALRAARRKA